MYERTNTPSRTDSLVLVYGANEVDLNVENYQLKGPKLHLGYVELTSLPFLIDIRGVVAHTHEIAFRCNEYACISSCF